MKAHWLTNTSAAVFFAIAGAYACSNLHSGDGAKSAQSVRADAPQSREERRPDVALPKTDPLAPPVSDAQKATSDDSGEHSDAPPQEAPRELPSGLKIGEPAEFHLEGDRPLRVTHARANQQHAIVYLHGMCGDSRGADGWADLAAERGTLIVVRATEPCPDRPGYKWPKEVEEIQSRIDVALAGGLLNQSVVTLIGYSQGANRAEKLAALNPQRYPLIVLGGPPTQPSPELLHSTQRVAILGGELEDTTHMELGDLALRQAGVPSHFFLLPRAHHGDYGPEGRRVISEAFAFLDQRN
jgi:predicted esterase